MSKKKILLDARQTSFDFDQPIEAYCRLRETLAAPSVMPSHRDEADYDEVCIEIAVAVKQAIRASGLSREKVVDLINDYFHWPKNDQRKGLSYHMFNHHLSKPVQYPMSAALVMGVQHVTKSLKPAGVMVEAEGGKVINEEEVRELNLGKVDHMVHELQRMKRELRIGGK
ncbi:MAG TPA: hypothetical protein VLL97_06950 [Acidobacteriota bacterium]|nr:hypothetical protein [Acidobacteriota bacterium]